MFVLWVQMSFISPNKTETDMKSRVILGKPKNYLTVDFRMVRVLPGV